MELFQDVVSKQTADAASKASKVGGSSFATVPSTSAPSLSSLLMGASGLTAPPKLGDLMGSEFMGTFGSLSRPAAPKRAVPASPSPSITSNEDGMSTPVRDVKRANTNASPPSSLSSQGFGSLASPSTPNNRQISPGAQSYTSIGTVRPLTPQGASQYEARLDASFNTHLEDSSLYIAPDGSPLPGPSTKFSFHKSALTEPYLHMFESAQVIGDVLETRRTRMEARFTNDAGLVTPAPVGSFSQGAITCVGRVVSDGDVRLADNKDALVLEGSKEGMTELPRMRLNLEKTSEYAVFPGQIIAVHGQNQTGAVMDVTQVFSGQVKPMTKTNKSALAHLFGLPAPVGPESIVSETAKPTADPTSILTAVGPYTASENMEYAALDAILAAVKASPPSVTVLVGPFIDTKHPMVASGKIQASGQPNVLSIAQLFDTVVAPKLHAIAAAAPEMTIVIVPSTNDAHHIPVFPQPPQIIEPPLGGGDIARAAATWRKQVKFAPNPSTFSVNEVKVGVVSTDVLSHLSREEIALIPHGKASDRMARLCRHLLNQRSYYPLYPGHKDAYLDMTHSDKLEMPVLPDILIVPSKIRHFVKVVDGVLCINPGFMVKGTALGSFCRTTVHPMTPAMINGTHQPDVKPVLPGGGASPVPPSISPPKPAVKAEAGAGDTPAKVPGGSSSKAAHQVASRARVDIFKALAKPLGE